VAAGAATHFVVTKRMEGGRTVSEITPLDPAARVREIARMLGGQTDAALRHAEALLEPLRAAKTPGHKLPRKTTKEARP
jgi:DNA repair protein RecN (Recombination protein N)